MNKLGIIVPYRNRISQLKTFKETIKKYLEKNEIEYELIIVEQGDAKLFNRGKLLNIGFMEARKRRCNYVVFHDVDMLPKHVDYSYSEHPLLLATDFVGINNIPYTKEKFDKYFGGVTLFPTEHFEQINGFSNLYWGWGFEDDDLLYRCKINKVPLDKKKIKYTGANGAALKFNGNNALVKAKNLLNIKKGFSIYINFNPESVLNHETYDDTYNVFTIPKKNMVISFNSYNRFNFDIRDKRGNVISLYTNITEPHRTTIVVTVDVENKTIKLYQDSKVIKEVTYENDLYNYNRVGEMYLGSGDPNCDMPNYFYGNINSFAIFNKYLQEKEVIEISNNKSLGLSQNFGDYTSAYALCTYYDAKFIREYKLIDLSGNDNNGIIENCEIIPYDNIDSKVIEVPYKRESTFILLPHKENGFKDGRWVDASIRYNQLRYTNEVSKGYSDTKKDGLINCEYVTHNKIKIKNLTHLIVGI